MSDNIDIPVTADGSGDIDRVTNAIDRMHASMMKLGGANPGLTRMSADMKAMTASLTTGLASIQDQLKQTQQTLATGFAAMTNVANQGAANFGASQERSLKAAGDKAVKALESNAVKMKEADARTWEQIQRGSAGNVTRAFNQLAQGVPVEKVQARLGALATSTATSFNGQLGQLRQFQANSKSLWDTHYKGLAGATEAQMGLAQKMNAQWNASMKLKAAGKVDVRTLLGLPSESDARDAGARIAAQMRAGVKAENARASAASKIDVRTLLGLPSEAETRTAGLQIAAQMRAAVNTESLRGRSAGKVDARTLLGLPSDASMKSFSSSLKAQMQEQAKGEGVIRRATAAMFQNNVAMHEAHGLARGLSGSLGGLWLTYGSMVPLAAGAAIAASLKNVVSVGKEVEYQLKFVEALGGGQVKLSDLLHITDQTVVSVKDAAGGLRALAQNGIDAADSLKVLPSILNLAVIGELDVGAAALAATGTVSAFGLALSDLDRVANIFAQAAATSNTSVAAMTESMKQASTVASVYGAQVEETAAALGVLAKVNITGSAAGTAYTNMLTNLYTPTEKAKKALAELGVTTDDGSGGLKNNTQLLGELRNALAKYNDTAQASMLGDIFTVRGQKGAATLLNNWDQYIEKAEEAREVTNYMGDAVGKLEDTVDGQSKRLSNSLSSAFAQAFEKSSPPLQALISQLATLARSDATVAALVGMADAGLRLTTVAIDNAAMIATVVVGFTALKIAAGAASAGMVATTQVMAVMRAGSLAAAVANGTLALSIRGVMAALGWIGIAIAAAVTAYQLFIEKTTDVEKADTRLRNSIEANIETLDREIERLEKRNELWNPETMKFDRAVPASQATTVEQIDAQIEAKRSELDKLKSLPVTYQYGRGNNATVESANSAASVARIAAAQKAIGELEGQRWELSTKGALAHVNAVAEGENRKREAAATSLEAFEAQTESYNKMSTTPGRFNGTDNPAIVALGAKAKTIHEQLKADTITDTEAALKLNGLIAERSKLLAGRAPKPEKDGAGARAENAALNAGLRKLEQDQAMQRMGAEAVMDEARAQNRRGELGDLQLINLELAKKQEINKMAVDTAKLQYTLADSADKVVKKQAYEGKEKIAKQQDGIDIAAAAEQRKTVFARMVQDESDFEQRSLADRGQHVQAFLAGYQADYAMTIANVQADQDASTDSAEMYRLQSYLDLLERMKQAGTDKALGKEIEESFGATIERMGLALDSLGDNSGPESGLGAYFSSALVAEQELSARLPELMAKQAEMQALADKPGASEDVKKKAAGQLRDIASMAAQMRGLWVGVGEAIGNSMTIAFGRAGKAAGTMMTVQIAHAARQKQINEDLNKKKGTDGYEAAQIQAIKDLDSAQVQAYANMAGAAKSYFDEGSRGYKALEAIERGFHAWQLAMNMEVMLSKLFATEVITAAKVGAAGSEIVAEMSTVAPTIGAEAAKSSAYGITALAASLAAPFPMNIAAFAVVGAMLAAIGVAVSGGGSKTNTTAKDRQEAAGTGSTFGDLGERQRDGTMKYKDKSDSIAKSLEIVSENSDLSLGYSDAMLKSLRAIETNIGGLTNLAIRGGSLQRADGIQTGTLKGAPVGKTAAAVLGGAAAGFSMGSTVSLIGSAMGPIGAVVGAAVGAVLSKAFKTKQEITDQGLNIDQQSYGDALSGVTGNTYADVNTKKKFLGMSYSNKDSTVNTGALDDEMSRQFSLVISGMGDGIKAALDVFGVGGDAFTERLKTFVINIGEISTKGLSGEEIEEQFQAVFSKLGDDMARFSISGLEQFQKVGEGYFETLIRIATDYQAVDAVMASVGKVFGAVGVDSIGAREKLIALSGGLEEFVSQADFFTKNFLKDGERLAPVQANLQKNLAPFETAGPIATLDDFAAAVRRFAGDTSEKGMEAYATLMKLAPAFKEVADFVAADLKARGELEQQIYALSHTASETLINDRRIELEAMDASLRPLQARIWALEDEKVALSLQKEIYDLSHTASEVLVNDRRLELAEMDASLRPLKERIWALQDEKVVLGLQKELYDLTHTAAEVLANDRRLELAEMDASLRPLKERIWALQDEKTAMDGLLSAVDDAFGILQRVINKEKERIQDLHDASMKSIDAQIAATKEGITKLKPLADALNSALESMNPVNSEADTRLVAQSQLQAALAVVRAGGPMPSADSLKGALSVLTKDSSDLFATMEDYQADFYATQNSLEMLSNLADAKLSVEEKMLASLETRKEDAIAAHEAELARLDGILEAAQLQIDVLRGVDISVMTVAAALANFKLTVAAAQANPVISGTAAIAKAYQDSLGRAPETAGLDYWKGQLANGSPIDAITDAIKNSPEAKIQDLYQSMFGREADAGGLDFWTKSMNSGMSIDEVRQAFAGSAEAQAMAPAPAREVNATMDRMSAASVNGQLVEELQASRQEAAAAAAKTYEMTEAHLYEILKNTRTSADIQDEWNNAGQPAVRQGEVVP